MIDVATDRSQVQFQKISRCFDLPDFVKTAIGSLPSDYTSYEAYADPVNRLYRCDSKAGTWLSMAYFSKCADLYKNSTLRRAVKLKIKKFADLWGIDWPDEKMFSKAASESFEVKIIDDDGEVLQKIGIRDQKDADEFTSVFFDNRPKYTYLMCRKVARQLLGMPKKIARLGDSVDRLQRMAGFGMTLLDDCIEKLQKRAVLAAHTPYGSRYGEIAKCAAQEPITPKSLHKWARIVDLTDRGANIHKLYGDYVQPPEDFLFRLNEKAAAQLKTSLFSLTNDHIYPKSVILKNAEEVQNWLTNYMGREWKANPNDPEEFLDAIRMLPPNVANDMVDLFQSLQRRGGQGRY